jgi:hypothetical protein
VAVDLAAAVVVSVVVVHLEDGSKGMTIDEPLEKRLTIDEFWSAASGWLYHLIIINQ